MSYHSEEEEDESVWLGKSKEHEHAEVGDEAEEELEEELGKIIHKAMKTAPGSMPGAGAPVPAPGTLAPGPVKTAAVEPVFGKCCKRMEKELLGQDNIMLWNELIKNQPMIVFKHNLNKIIHCPWCGVKIPEPK